MNRNSHLIAPGYMLSNEILDNNLGARGKQDEPTVEHVNIEKVFLYGAAPSLPDAVLVTCLGVRPPEFSGLTPVQSPMAQCSQGQLIKPTKAFSQVCRHSITIILQHKIV